MVKKILTLFTSIMLLCLMAAASASVNVGYLWDPVDLSLQTEPMLISDLSIEAGKINMADLTTKQIATGSLDTDAAGIQLGALSGQDEVWYAIHQRTWSTMATVSVQRSQRGGAIVSGTRSGVGTI